MGNKQSTPVIKIATTSASIFAGEPIEGTVNLFLPYEMNDVIIIFSLKGKETCNFRVEKNPNDQIGKIFILNFHQVLYNSSGMFVRPGKYTIPFAISTPRSIPGTFELSHKRNTARISYAVKAWLTNQKNEKLTKDKSIFLIKQAISTRRISIVGNSEQEIRKCGCLRMGKCTLNAHLDKNAYLPGETITVSINIDNTKNGSKVRQVIVNLIRTTRLISKNHQSIVLRNQIASQKKKLNLRPGSSLLNNEAIEVSLKIQKKNQNLMLCGTTNGRIIECSYHLEISSFCGLFHSNGPSIDLVVMIFPNEIEIPAPTAPEDWNPVELGQVLMESNEANPYG